MFLHLCLMPAYIYDRASPVVPTVKYLPAGSIPGSGRSVEKGMATYSSVLAWRIPWIEDPDRL